MTGPVQPASEPEPPQYNPMFETFVGEGKPDSEEIVGLVAYALYKKAKIEYVRKIRAKHRRPPNEDELRNHYEGFTSQQVEATRLVASSALINFAESFVDDARPGIIKDALSGKFWPDVGKAMFSSFLYTAMLILAVLVLRWSGVDVLSLLEKASPPKSEVQGVGPAPTTGARIPAKQQ